VVTKKRTRSGMIRSSKSPVDRLDLYAIGLDSLNANLERYNYASAHSEDAKSVKRRIKSTYKVSDYSKEHLDITGTLNLEVEAKGYDKPILSLVVVLTGHFHPKNGVTRKEAEDFAEAEATLVFWPYFRQIVSDTTARMHIGAITLPLAVG